MRMAIGLGLMVLGSGVALAQLGPGFTPAAKQGAPRDLTITRDDWGIAHVHGRTDADAVFGMVYAQCEDDFNRVEMNYLTSLGRVAEAEGETAVWSDLRQRLFIDPVELQKEYAAAPAWLKSLMDAWAAGVNVYLAKHPDVKPKVLTRFEPWMALSFTEGSIGGDIERVDLKALQQMYGPGDTVQRTAVGNGSGLRGDGAEQEPGGSNGIAIAPRLTRDGHALLLINPHTSFFFRSELQMQSDEGLHAYGAVTWGQFFVYQGFNEHTGWMHTSSGVDAVDEFLETVTPGKDGYSYRHGTETHVMPVKEIVLRVRTAAGMTERRFRTFSTAHGPVVRRDGNRPVTVALMQRHVAALEQSWLRTKARNYNQYRKTMELMGNSSNNTVYADMDGTIAYWHGDFIPRRDRRFDFTAPVDGSDLATDWHGLLALDEVPQLKNPASGWLFNVNDAPWQGAGESSLKKADFPAYVEQGLETARGLHAVRVLTGKTGWTAESLRAAAYDSYLPWFAKTLPRLLTAWDAMPVGAAKEKLREPVALLRAWDDRWGAESVATSVAVYWGTAVLKGAGPAVTRVGVPSEDFVATQMPPAALIEALGGAVDRLTVDFGSWQTPWGAINRFQRLTSDIAQPFSDAGVSLPVPFVSSTWGSLASFGARPYPGTKRWYGTSGNSFVAVVEFGPRVRAFAVTAGGESGAAGSKHFNDEAVRYASGDLRRVYFWPDELEGHVERQYRPGE